MKRKTVIAAGVTAVVVVVAVIALIATLRYGFSAHDEPTRIEIVLARTMRHWAAPTSPCSTSRKASCDGGKG